MAKTSTKSRYRDRTDIIVVDYDPAWPDRYERERALIAGALGELAVAIEHVGSTAVAGLAAKPFVDIMVGLRALGDMDGIIEPLDDVGYEYRGDGGLPEHYFFRKGDPRIVQLHVVQHESAFWSEHIAFREALRRSPSLAREYGELKRQLADRFPDDKVAYNKAKEPFILNALTKHG